ncbi:unnamed protein product [Moneuplotes crassus]|uniref:Uncharacterized protein n=1 Tax=Euplotes crassus TaxID=5936 RepID=A0AAD1U9M6_EUPCR|nr:unnamed protein product [Moneuplotes crassus]
MSIIEKEASDREISTPHVFVSSMRKQSITREKTRTVHRARRAKKIQGLMSFKLSKPLDLKNFTMKDRLEEKLFYYYGNYNKSGFTFDEYMGFEEIGHELFDINEGNGLRKRKVIPKKNPNWSRIADLILKWKGKSFARALKRINNAYSLLNNYDSLEKLREIENDNAAKPEKKISFKKLLKKNKDLKIEIGHEKRDVSEVISKCIYNKVEKLKNKPSLFKKVTTFSFSPKKNSNLSRKTSSIQPRQRDIKNLSSCRERKLKKARMRRRRSKKTRSVDMEIRLEKIEEDNEDKKAEPNKFLDMAKFLACKRAYERRSVVSNYSAKRKQTRRKIKTGSVHDNSKNSYNDSSYIAKTSPNSIKQSHIQSGLKDLSIFNVESPLETCNLDNRPNTVMGGREIKEENVSEKSIINYKMQYLKDYSNKLNAKKIKSSKFSQRRKSTQAKKISSFKMPASKNGFQTIRKSVVSKQSIGSTYLSSKANPGHLYSSTQPHLHSYLP